MLCSEVKKALNAGPLTGTPGVAVVRIVPLLSGKSSVLFVLLFGLAIVKMPVPPALALRVMLLMAVFL